MCTWNSRLAKIMRPREKSCVPIRVILRFRELCIYINDPPDSKNFKIWLFADDTAIYLAVSSLQNAQILQQDLHHFNNCELEWDMEFNPGMCVVIHITRSRTPIPSQNLLHGQVLESVAGSKYLGVEISSNLHVSFNNHIQSITTSASRSLGFLRRNTRTQKNGLQNSFLPLGGILINRMEALH